MFGIILATYFGMTMFIFFMSTFMMTLERNYSGEDILINAVLAIVWPFIAVLLILNFLFTPKD